MYRLLEWAFAYDDGSGLPDAGAYAAELKNVTATADGKPVQGFDPTKTGTWTIPAGTQVNIVDMPDDWKLDGKAEQPAGTVVFTASKYGTPVVTWTFKNDSATDPDKPADPGTDALKNVAATADGKPIAGFDPTRDGAYKVAAGAKVRISDVPSDWKLDKTESGSKLVFTASKGGTAVTWTFEYQANGGSSATDPGNGGGSNAGGDGQGDPGKTPDTSKPAASPKPAGTADDGQAAGAAPLASTGAGTGPAIAVAGLLAMAGCLCSISCCGFSHDDFSGLGRACRPRNGLNWMVLVSPPERTGKDYDQHAPSTVYPSFAAERGIRRVDRAENTCQRADGA